jgi:hypothetical protein
MTCKDIEEKLPAYQEGTLSPDEKRLVDAHISKCTQCSAALQDLEKTLILLRNLPEVEPPPWFTQKIMAQVREEGTRKHSLFRKLFYPFHVKIPIEAFATLLVVILGVYIYQSTIPVTQTIPQSPLSRAEQDAPDSSASEEASKVTQKSIQTESRRGPDVLHPPEKTFAPIPRSERLAMPEQEQKPANTIDIPSVSGIAKESKQEGLYQSTPPLPSSAPSPAPLGRQKGAPMGAGAGKQGPSSLADRQDGAAVTVQVTDMRAAARDIEQVLIKIGMRIISRQSLDKKERIYIDVQHESLNELLHQLRKVGVVKESVPLEKLREHSLISIEIVGD